MRGLRVLPYAVGAGAFALCLALASLTPHWRAPALASELGGRLRWIDPAHSERIAFALLAALGALFVARVIATSTRGAPRVALAAASAASATLLLGTAWWWSLSCRAALALCAALYALVAWRQVAGDGEPPARSALGASLATAAAAGLAPALGAIAAPAAALWWLRVGRHHRRVLGRRERRAALLLVPPALLCAALVVFARVVAASGGDVGGLGAAAATLGPTAVAASLAGVVALAFGAAPDPLGPDRATLAVLSAMALGASAAATPGFAIAPVALCAGIALARLGAFIAGPGEAPSRLDHLLAVGAGLVATAVGFVVALPALL